MSRYAKNFSTKKTKQTEPIPGTTQVENNAGGFGWAVDDWMRMQRFLILGTEGGSYYATEQKLTVENAKSVLKCIESDGLRATKLITEISVTGRAPKNDAAIFALALAASNGKHQSQALDALPEICRTGTHLFQFIDAVQNFRGWGRGLRKAVAGWYTGKSIDQMAYQLVKYRRRGGWTHRDALRLSHACPVRDGHSQVFRWATGKTDVPLEKLPSVIQGYIELQTSPDVKSVVKTLEDFPNLPWEAIDSKFLGDSDIWAALLDRLPIIALTRNLSRMTANGLLAPMSDAVETVVGRLGDAEAVKKSRIHPIAVLGALLTYQSGQSARGSSAWNPVQKIVDALDEMFYASFGNVIPTGKRWLLGLDVSGSMAWGDGVGGMKGLTPNVAAAAMAMVAARTEPNHFIGAFTSGEDGFSPVKISPRQRLDDVVRTVGALPMGGTDCSLPMVYALKRKIPTDVFVVYTDNETWAGPIHPVQALNAYRRKMGIPAKLIVVGMTSGGFTIADPNDAGMMDVVGFDMATPQVMSDFAR